MQNTHITISRKHRDLLKKLAARERRTMRSMIELYIEATATKRGVLPTN